MKFFRYISFLFLLVAPIFTACQDELLYYNETEIGEGEANLNVNIAFHPLEGALETRAEGNAVSKVEKLWVVIYKINPDGSEAGLYDKVRIYDYEAAYEMPGSGFKIDQTGNSANPGDAETFTPSDNQNVGPDDGTISGSGETTPSATFNLNHIPFGRYKMFAVANVDLTDVDCTTINDLRGKRFDWQEDVKLDNQMFGYVTLATTPTSSGFDSPPLIINQSSIGLHAWIKRLVSKVTVAFDGSELMENVHVYIKSVTLHDIPRSCALGLPNSPDKDADLITNGESFRYYEAGQGANADHAKWKLEVTKGSGTVGQPDHSESDQALYFYENLQGNYEGVSRFDKRQDPGAVGTPIDSIGDGPDYKDAQLYGTYVEVEAYYDSRHKDKISQGPIKYRFMLGKNSTFDYDAERNYHYKLTLKLRGWANEADWHISYKEYTPTLITPEPYYISYLYNQEMEFPARVLTGDDSVFDYVVKAEIVENNWWPWDVTTQSRPPQFVGPQNEFNGFAWNVPAFEQVYPYVPYKRGNPDPYGGSNYVGFLSLRPNTSDVIGTFEMRYGEEVNTFLKDYYKDNNLAVNEYPLNGAGTSYDPIDKSVSLRIPMYTRNKEMAPMTDFSGNNPFNAYIRFAKVRFTLWKDGQQVEFLDEEGNKDTERIATIQQVTRVENPKAIYRDANNDDEFEIKLMTLPNAGTSTYDMFESDGPWRASIMCQTEPFIQLTGLDGKTITKTGDYVQGSTSETIQFTYKPDGKIDDDKVRCGIIKVEYNDYNCVHLIFVRQGYHKGVELGDATWSCYNVYATAATNVNRTAPADEKNVKVFLTRSPLFIGSYLKRNQYNYTLLPINNEKYGWLASVGSFDTGYIKEDNTLGTRSATWGNIQGFGWVNYDATEGRVDRHWADTWTAVGGFQDDQTFAVPTAENFKALTNNCKFGYGIVYGDGAKTTAREFSEANGYVDFDNIGERSTKGIRACVVYDEKDGKNIIFPLSAVGQARRLRQNGSINYGGVTSVLSGNANMYRPLTYNLYRTPGAVYWINQPVVTSESSNLAGVNKPDYASWDINYLNLVFNPYDYGTLGGWDGDKYTNYYINNKGEKVFNLNAGTSSDALPIKLIYAPEKNNL